MRLPARSFQLLIVLSAGNRRSRPVARNGMVKSTTFVRAWVTTVEPASMSTVPLTRSGMRVCEVTGTRLSFMLVLSSFSIFLCTSRAISVERPVQLLSLSR